MTRQFEDKLATREKVPLLVGLFGTSGSGKTYSALRLASGIQRVNGGDIFMVDTEAKRSLHYADKFNFRHVNFKAPFSPLDYLAAIEHCVGKGASVIVIDSLSHEHEGPGGVLEMHDKELDRLAGKDEKKRNAMTFSAWGKPKADRDRLINTMLQMECSFILCFRAKEKMKLLSKAERDAAREENGGRYVDPVKQMGFMPIGDTRFIYEMTASCLLYPGAGGVPTWNSGEPGEKMLTKLPQQFRSLFSEQRPLDETIGEEMARWADGDAVGPFAETKKAIEDALSLPDLEKLVPRLAEIKEKRLVPGSEYQALRKAYGARQKSLEEAADEYSEPEEGAAE